MYPRSPAHHVRTRYWFFRAYGRVIAGVLAATVITFLVSFPGRDVFPFGRVLTPAEDFDVAEFYATHFGFDVAAPLHHQFAEFTVTRLGHPAILAVVVGAAVVALALEWNRGRLAS